MNDSTLKGAAAPNFQKITHLTAAESDPAGWQDTSTQENPLPCPLAQFCQPGRGQCLCKIDSLVYDAIVVNPDEIGSFIFYARELLDLLEDYSIGILDDGENTVKYGDRRGALIVAIRALVDKLETTVAGALKLPFPHCRRENYRHRKIIGQEGGTDE